MKEFKKVQDFRDWMPEFFSRSNRRFFRDVKYRIWKGCLILEQRSIHDYMPHDFSIYKPFVTEDGEQDLLCIGHAQWIEDARKVVNLKGSGS